jgi:hypothetical protein
VFDNFEVWLSASPELNQRERLKKVPLPRNQLASGTFPRPKPGDQLRVPLALSTGFCNAAWDAGIGLMKDMLKSTVSGAVRRQGVSPDPLGPNSEIGRKLKQYYDDLVSDEIPDRFAQLLAKLEKTEAGNKKD